MAVCRFAKDVELSYALTRGEQEPFFHPFDRWQARFEGPAQTPGEVAEWSNARAWKARVGESLPRVRIPPSPPFFFRNSKEKCPPKPWRRRTSMSPGLPPSPKATEDKSDSTAFPRKTRNPRSHAIGPRRRMPGEASAKQGSLHYVYLITSASGPGQHRHVGYTDDLRQRLADHNAGKNVSTAPHRPWRLRTYVAFSTKPQALVFERCLKSGSSHAFAKKRLW